MIVKSIIVLKTFLSNLSNENVKEKFNCNQLGLPGVALSVMPWLK